MLELNIDLATAFRHFSLIFGSSIVSFLIALLLTPGFAKTLIKLKLRKNLRETTIGGEAAEIFRSLHIKKEGTPTMGGLLIWLVTLGVILISPLFQYFNVTRFSLFNRNETYLPLFTLVTVGALGALDDVLNVKKIGKTHGMTVKFKMLWLTIFGLAGGWWFHAKLGYDFIHVPGLGDLQLGFWYIPLFAIIIVASANAVNFTDGLDGLAGGLLVISFTALGIISYLHGLVILTAFCGVIVGTTLAFLWFNIPPALFYMGDTGALALGATMGVIAMLTDSLVILPFIAFVYVIETLSVIIQIVSKKLFHRKVFKIAPLHHHFEAVGWPEGKVVMRFWILGGFTAVLGVILEILNIVDK